MKFAKKCGIFIKNAPFGRKSEYLTKKKQNLILIDNVVKCYEMLHLRCNVAFSQNFIRFAKSDNVVTMLFQKIAQRNVAFSTISHHFPEKWGICIF